ncbi:PIN domain-containing protein [Chloracidobacterium sp. D]|jgi:predicted nucleic acid-binding protein|uniref:PIN domain-containing protein n=1 Tax=Chloracidobacterium sp. D TaxID=2821536 RepID=UPI001B8ACE24|nr:PIN domain-containing protein [Chloracidobacterium sp. D]QUV83005.1 PIN domain-containing protein [Chloracidobacterium sp. D]
MPKRTYIDTSVLMAAFTGQGETGQRALSVLDDPERTLVVSDAVRLEALPMAHYHRQPQEAAFYEAVFSRAENIAWNVSALEQAQNIAEAYGIAAMEAVHIAHAIAAEVDEFMSAGKPTKPMFRVTGICMRSIRDA